jgi:hypothetical protein
MTSVGDVDTVDRDANTAPDGGQAGGWWQRLRPYLPLLAIGVAAFLLRLALLKWVREPCTAPGEASVTGACFEYGGDTRYVGTQAHYLVEGHGFINAGKAMYGVGGIDEPGAAHPPLFTLILAALQWIGITSVESWRVFMSFVGSVGVVLIGVAGWRLGGTVPNRSDDGRSAVATGPRSHFIGVCAALIAAINPLLWSRDVDLYVEALLIPLIALYVIATLRLARRPTLLNATLVGATIGIAWLARSEQIAVLILTFPLFLWGLRVPLGRRIGFFAATGAIAGLLMAPWLVYNHARFERPVLLSTNLGVALLLGACDDSYYGADFGWFSWDCVYDFPVGPEGDDSVYDRQRTKAALDYIRAHPRRTPVVMAARGARFWRVYEIGNSVQREALIEGHGWVAARTGLLALYGLVPFAVAGTVSLRRRRMPISPLLAPIIVASLAAVVLIPMPRFRTPADVAITILAAVGVDAAWRWLRDRSLRSAADQPRHAAGR